MASCLKSKISDTKSKNLNFMLWLLITLPYNIMFVSHLDYWLLPRHASISTFTWIKFFLSTMTVHLPLKKFTYSTKSINVTLLKWVFLFSGVRSTSSFDKFPYFVHISATVFISLFSIWTIAQRFYRNYSTPGEKG